MKVNDKTGLDSALFYAKRGKRNKHEKWKIEKLKVGQEIEKDWILEKKTKIFFESYVEVIISKILSLTRFNSARFSIVNIKR